MSAPPSPPDAAPPDPTAGGLSAPTLGQVVDEHLRWITRWHRGAFYGRDGLPGGADQLAMPTAFLLWVRHVKANALTDQPAVDRLVTVHEQLHRMARLVLMQSVEGGAPSLAAYDAVIAKFDDFIAQCRRFERAFSLAGSGIDPLTGLRNRTGLEEELAREMNRFRRTGNPFCLAFCDLDRFKAVNDTYGHEAGDRVLVAVAGAIARGIRSFDEAFRLGGEEILILLKDTTLPEAGPVLERLRADIAAQPVALADGRNIRVTASFGVVQARLDLSIDGIMERADQALYDAKRQGRDRVVAA